MRLQIGLRKLFRLIRLVVITLGFEKIIMSPFSFSKSVFSFNGCLGWHPPRLFFPIYFLKILKGFPESLVGKESAYNAGDPGLIPGSGRSTGEGIGYPLQYSWVSLVAQLVKNPPAMRETCVRSLGWEDPLEKGKATHSSILAWRIPRTV